MVHVFLTFSDIFRVELELDYAPLIIDFLVVKCPDLQYLQLEADVLHIPQLFKHGNWPHLHSFIMGATIYLFEQSSGDGARSQLFRQFLLKHKHLQVLQILNSQNVIRHSISLETVPRLRSLCVSEFDVPLSFMVALPTHGLLRLEHIRARVDQNSLELLRRSPMLRSCVIRLHGVTLAELSKTVPKLERLGYYEYQDRYTEASFFFFKKRLYL